jgi:secondary thiamine-phosphate synthase enzyme
MLRSRHTTAALTCTEGDPSIHEDCLELLREQLPASRSYRHSQEGAENAVAHLAEMMIFGDSTWAPVRGGKLDLGTWQRLFLVELFEPRTRTVDLAILG